MALFFYFCKFQDFLSFYQVFGQYLKQSLPASQVMVIQPTAHSLVTQIITQNAAAITTNLSVAKREQIMYAPVMGTPKSQRIITVRNNKIMPTYNN